MTDMRAGEGKTVADEETSELGILRSIMITHDDQGIEVLRATVDFYNGAAPNVKFSCVWEQSPVRIVEVKATDGLLDRQPHP